MTADNNDMKKNDEQTMNEKRKRRVPNIRRTSPIKAGSLSFAIDKFSDDCLPLQYLRELTQNSIEAMPKGKSGNVRWTYDTNWKDQNGSLKLCIIDDGIGMTGRDVSKYINTMWESGKGLGRTENFGMGVKISAGPSNPVGIEYYTWKDGVGYFATFWYDESINDYGMKLIEDENGGLVDWIEEIDDKFMPPLIKKNGGNGVKVVLLGRSEKENTFLNPDAPMPSRWIEYNLNNRYYDLPEDVKIVSRRIDGERIPSRTLGTVFGIKNRLSKHSLDKGIINMRDGRIHWMLLNDPEVRHKFTQFDSGAQSGVLFQNEIYEKLNKMAHRTRMASKFGLMFAHNRVAIFVEPDIEDLDTDLVRKRLVMPGQEIGLPWVRWGWEFRENMPESIRKIESELNDKAQKGNDLEIRNRIEKFLKENKLPRFEADLHGAYDADAADSNFHKSGTKGDGDGDLPDKSENDISKRDYSHYIKPKSKRKSNKELRKPSPLDINWISEDNGTRDSEHLTDMAAEWHPETRKLLINEDARMWKTTYQEVLETTTDGDLIRNQHIQKRCQLEYGWDLALTVLKAYQVNDNVNWDKPKIEGRMLSPEALTGASLANKYLVSYLKRNMSNWLVKKQVEEWVP